MPAAEGVEAAAELLRGAERPVIMAGTGLYWAHGENALRAIAEELRIPVFVNGLGRGCIPADHELAFSRARGNGLKGADVALVIGVPMDFRLGFGGSFGDDTKSDRARRLRRPSGRIRARWRPTCIGGVPATLDALREAAAGGPDRSGWIESLQEVENEKRAAEQDELNDDRARRCIRCASTASWRRCSTATRS